MPNSPACLRSDTGFGSPRQTLFVCAVHIGLCVSPFVGGSARATDIIVNIDGLTSTKGTVLLELDGSEASWQNLAPSAAVGKVLPTAKQVTYVFKGVKPGTYGLSAIHDENENGKFDTNFLGIPTEGWGFSNNPDIKRKAKFEEAKFSVAEEDVTITIHMHAGR